MNTKSTMQLGSLDGLFVEKDKELKQIIGNLQIGEAKDDDKNIRFPLYIKLIHST